MVRIHSLVLVLLIAGSASAQDFKIYTGGKQGDAKGVKITAIPKAGIENKLGLKPGDTIQRINGKAITTEKELAEALAKIPVHKVTDERKAPTTNLTFLRSDKDNKDKTMNISGWIIQSSFPDAKTGRTQFYFRSKDPPKGSANSK